MISKYWLKSVQTTPQIISSHWIFSVRMKDGCTEEPPKSLKLLKAKYFSDNEMKTTLNLFRWVYEKGLTSVRYTCLMACTDLMYADWVFFFSQNSGGGQMNMRLKFIIKCLSARRDFKFNQPWKKSKKALKLWREWKISHSFSWVFFPFIEIQLASSPSWEELKRFSAAF